MNVDLQTTNCCCYRLSPLQIKENGSFVNPYLPDDLQKIVGNKRRYIEEK